MTKTKLEKIAALDTEIQQLENRRKQLLQQQKEQDRKARTKRLIERGAILESLIPNAAMLTNEQIKVFLEQTVHGEHACKILENLNSQSKAATTDPAENIMQGWG